MGKSYFHYQHNHNGWDRLPKTTFFKWQDKKKYQMLSNNNDQFISSSSVKQLDFLSDKVFVHSSERLVEKNENVLTSFKRYEVVGQGKDGVIYRLSSDRCIKVFFKEEVYEKELEAIQVGQPSSIIPQLYGYGPNYIVMEYIEGISLAKQLKKNGDIEKSLVVQLIDFFDELKKLNFRRQDTELRHILINEQGNFKMIDLKRAFTSNRPIPIKLLTDLKELKLSKEFLSHVKDIRPSLYQRWKKFDEK
ncbi:MULTISPECIES: hypothetical protein [Bacillaceae]|uniref:Protein kinase domain-containing protein n=2 Tax=Priestia TaxID=2800373 RepID=A0AAX6NIH5_PRIAR|nr:MULTISPECIES: hypothetical protein [Bacillaceae]MDU9695693.1 hypothetical protein [Priestia aryabhattai]WJN47658.1 hypothetical protein QUH71_27205 [Priestia aryabhattai]